MGVTPFSFMRFSCLFLFFTYFFHHLQKFFLRRYSEFLNKEYKADGAYADEYGSYDFTYREGYHKLLVDFKMFDLLVNVRKKKDGSFVYSFMLEENNMKAEPPHIPPQTMGFKPVEHSALGKGSITQTEPIVNTLNENPHSDRKIVDIPKQKADGETDIHQFLYSDRSKDSVSNRSLLANALESTVQNDMERNRLNEHKNL